MRTFSTFAVASVVALALAAPVAAQSNPGTQEPGSPQSGAGQSGAGQAGQPGMGAPQPGSDIAVGRENRTNSRDDLQKFVEKAAMSNMAEIELGQLAQSRAQDPEVKQFAQMMIDTHTRAQTELQQAASSSGITVPSSLDEKHQKAQQKLSNLNGAEFDREYMKLMVKSHKDTQKLLEKRVRSASVSESAGVSGSSGSAASGGTSGSGTETTSGSTPSGTQGTSGTSGSATGVAGTSGSGSVSASAGAASSASIDSWASSTLSDVQQHLQQAQDLEKRIKDGGSSDKSASDRNDK